MTSPLRYLPTVKTAVFTFLPSRCLSYSVRSLQKSSKNPGEKGTPEGDHTIGVLQSHSLFEAAAAPSPFRASGPTPPRLPKEDQDIFEKLQREAMMSGREDIDSSDITDSSPRIVPSGPATAPSGNDARMLHPHVRAAIPPEFEGDVNPKTGEVGGPKNEPLRWGTKGDWSYGGRTTDF